nr:hypothetical protein [Ferrimonas balearica]
MNNPLAGTDPTGYSAECSSEGVCDVGNILMEDVESISITEGGNMVVNTNDGSSYQVDSIGGKNVQGAFTLNGSDSSQGVNSKGSDFSGSKQTTSWSDQAGNPSGAPSGFDGTETACAANECSPEDLGMDAQAPPTMCSYGQNSCSTHTTTVEGSAIVESIEQVYVGVITDSGGPGGLPGSRDKRWGMLKDGAKDVATKSLDHNLLVGYRRPVTWKVEYEVTYDQVGTWRNGEFTGYRGTVNPRDIKELNRTRISVGEPSRMPGIFRRDQLPSGSKICSSQVQFC